jgi:hypothetical protein
LHHLSSGVDKIIIADNGSVDGTIDIMRKYKEVEITNIDDDVKNKLRRIAVANNAKWIINVNVNEFCYNLQEANNLLDGVTLVRIDHICDYLSINDIKSTFDPLKMPFWIKSRDVPRYLHRAFPDVVVDKDGSILNCPGVHTTSKKIWMKRYRIHDSNFVLHQENIPFLLSAGHIQGKILL